MLSLSSPTSPRPNDVKHALHKDVFHPNGERLVGFMRVSKTDTLLSLSKKENVHYLCCSVTVKRPVRAFISRYRKPDKGEGYEQRRRWPLEELTKVDGHSTVATCLQFDLHFDRAFCFEAGAYREKEDFLESLASVCSKHLNNGARPPLFENVSQKVRKPLPSATELAAQMAKNKRELQERGHRISELENRTAEMAETARTFSETARDLANHYKK